MSRGDPPHILPFRRNVSRSLVISEMIAAQLPSAEAAEATKKRAQ